MVTRASRMQARRHLPVPSAATWLSFAAAPAFAVMVILAGLSADAMPVTCLGGTEGSFLGGMTWMYLMMSVFHLPPWLRLFAARQATGPA